MICRDSTPRIDQYALPFSSDHRTVEVLTAERASTVGLSAGITYSNCRRHMAIYYGHDYVLVSTCSESTIPIQEPLRLAPKRRRTLFCDLVLT